MHQIIIGIIHWHIRSSSCILRCKNLSNVLCIPFQRNHGATSAVFRLPCSFFSYKIMVIINEISPADIVRTDKKHVRIRVAALVHRPIHQELKIWLFFQHPAAQILAALCICVVKMEHILLEPILCMVHHICMIPQLFHIIFLSCFPDGSIYFSAYVRIHVNLIG